MKTLLLIIIIHLLMLFSSVTDKAFLNESASLNPCNGSQLFLVHSGKEEREFITTNPSEGYSRQIILWPDSIFSFEVRSRAGVEFSAGYWRENDSLLIFHHDNSIMKLIFKRRPKAYKYKFYKIVDFNQVYLKKENSVCYLRG